MNSVLLRQNPHNVHEWHKRAKLFKDQDNPRKVRRLRLAYAYRMRMMMRLTSLLGCAAASSR